MTCSQWNEVLFEIADGECHSDQHQAALEHLADCSRCADFVAAQRGLRQSVNRMIQSETVPASLIANLKRQYAQPAVHNIHQHRSARHAVRWMRGVAAASLLLAAGFAAWFQFGGSGAVAGDALAMAPTLADRAVRTHCLCLPPNSPVALHQSSTLPGTLEELREDSEDLPRPLADLAMVDLSPLGFEFESSNNCGLERFEEGLHLTYSRMSDNVMLSVFTVPHIEMADATSSANATAMYAATVVQGSTEQPMTYAVIGWQNNASGVSYIACAPMDPTDLYRVARGIREAMRDGDSTVRLAPGETDIRRLFRPKTPTDNP